MYRMLVVAAGLIASAGAQAHPGHHDGAAVETVAHIWTHADHWLPAVGVLTVVIAGAVYLRSRHVLRKGDHQHDE